VETIRKTLFAGGVLQIGSFWGAAAIRCVWRR
jgi:hypothetical protein